MNTLKIFLIILFCVASTSLFAQDTSSIRLLVDSVETNLQLKDYRGSLEYLGRLEEKSRQPGLDTLVDLQMVYGKMGLCYYFLGIKDSTLHFFREGLRSLDIRDSTSAKMASELLNNISTISAQTGQMDDAVYSAKQSVRVLNPYFRVDADPRFVGKYLQIGNIFAGMPQPDSALIYYDKALALFENQPVTDEYEEYKAKVLMSIGSALMNQERFGEAIDTLKQATKRLSAVKGSDHPLTIQARQKIASVYARIGDYDASTEINSVNRDILIEKYGEKNSSLAVSMSNIGVNYLNQGKYLKAKDQLIASLGAIPKDGSTMGNNVKANVYYSLGIVFNSLGDYERSANSYRYALDIQEKIFPSSHPVIGRSLASIADKLWGRIDQDSLIGMYARALEIIYLTQDSLANDVLYYERKLAEAKIRYGFIEDGKALLRKSLARKYQDTPLKRKFRALSVYALSNPQLWESQPDSAVWYAKYSLQLMKATPAIEMLHLGRCYMRLGNLALSQNDVVGLAYYEAEYDKVYGVDTITDWARVDFPMSFLEWHVKRIDYRLDSYLAHGGPSTFDQIVALVEQANQCASFLRSRGGYPGKLLAIERGVLELAVSAHQYNHVTDGQATTAIEALRFADRTQSRLMAAALRSSELAGDSPLPAKLQATEADIDNQRNLLNNLEGRIRRNTVMNVDSAKTALFQQREALFLKEAKWLAYMKSAVPNYHNVRFQEPHWTVEEVRSKLVGPKRAIVSYLMRDSVSYIFVLTSDTLIVRPQYVDKTYVDSLVRQFVELGINGYHDAPRAQRTSALRQKSAQALTDTGSELYDILLKPVADFLPVNLTIIPDGPLAYLPFSALMSGPPKRFGNLATYPFLVKQYAISYGFSIAQQLRMKAESSTAQGWVGFAPFAVANDTAIVPTTKREISLADPLSSLDPLPATEGELTNIAAINGGIIFLREKANRAAFMEAAASAGTLHVATHGVADYRNPQDAYLALALVDSTQYDPFRAGEIYALPLSADLVVLSACESSVGRPLEGEGPQSIERAFAYAGARSIISALWAANDQKTSDLMIGFYRAMGEGQSRDRALRSSMLSVYNNGDKPNVHPFYWSGWILRGGTENPAIR